jgi:hypothetical protein
MQAGKRADRTGLRERQNGNWVRRKEERSNRTRGRCSQREIGARLGCSLGRGLGSRMAWMAFGTGRYAGLSGARCSWIRGWVSGWNRCSA